MSVSSLTLAFPNLPPLESIRHATPPQDCDPLYLKSLGSEVAIQKDYKIRLNACQRIGWMTIRHAIFSQCYLETPENEQIKVYILEEILPHDSEGEISYFTLGSTVEDENLKQSPNGQFVSSHNRQFFHWADTQLKPLVERAGGVVLTSGILNEQTNVIERIFFRIARQNEERSIDEAKEHPPSEEILEKFFGDCVESRSWHFWKTL